MILTTVMILPHRALISICDTWTWLCISGQSIGSINELISGSLPGWKTRCARSNQGWNLYMQLDLSMSSLGCTRHDENILYNARNKLIYARCDEPHKGGLSTHIMLCEVGCWIS